MATAFNDTQAWVKGNGNLSLGFNGADDGASDATRGYAKGDVFTPVPIIPGSLTSVVQALTFARTSAGLYTAALAAAASTGIVIVPLTGLFRKFAGGPGAITPHGLKLLDLSFGYTVGTANETTVSVAFYTETQTNATARASATYGGAVAYENPIGTVVANLPVAQQATPYVARAYPAVPAAGESALWINTDLTQLFAEISFVNPGTSVAILTFMMAHWAVALY